MADKNKPQESNNIASHDDPLDINELANLNEDFTPEFLEQLQNQLTQNVLSQDSESEPDDTKLFEEVPESLSQTNSSESNNGESKDSVNSDINGEKNDKEIESEPKKETKSLKLNLDDSIDDNFIKKYKAKLNKQQIANATSADEATKPKKSKFAAFETNEADIGALTGGNIIEKPILNEIVDYNDSLDLLDENVKYSKYVIYVDPENTDFIESLTVKERKNLINKILREQDDIMLTKRRFNTVQTVIKHTIVAIITIAIAIPIVYYTINASLEASIDNYRRSKSMFHTIYKERGKIKAPSYR